MIVSITYVAWQLPWLIGTFAPLEGQRLLTATSTEEMGTRSHPACPGG
jgi:hypothetical protein